jgi:hypothetical protein
LCCVLPWALHALNQRSSAKICQSNKNWFIKISGTQLNHSKRNHNDAYWLLYPRWHTRSIPKNGVVLWSLACFRTSRLPLGAWHLNVCVCASQNISKPCWHVVSCYHFSAPPWSCV